MVPPAVLLAYCGKLGDLGAAARAAEEARVLAAATGDGRSVTSALASVAFVRKLEGDPGAAAGLFEQALASAQARGDRFMTSTVHNNLAVVLADQGDLAGAVNHYQAAHAIESELAHPGRMAILDVNLGTTRAAMGDHASALSRYESALTALRSLGNQRAMVATLVRMIESLVITGSHDDAERRVEGGLTMARAIGMPVEEGALLDLSGWIARKRGDIIPCIGTPSSRSGPSSADQEPTRDCTFVAARGRGTHPRGSVGRSGWPNCRGRSRRARGGPAQVDRRRKTRVRADPHRA